MVKTWTSERIDMVLATNLGTPGCAVSPTSQSGFDQE